MLKKKFQDEELVIGTWMSLPSSAVAEIMALSGFDLVVIDLEHSVLSMAEAGELIRVIDLAGSAPIVRVSSNDGVQIKRVLDAGAEGIIVPMITTVEEVQAAADSMFFPPNGKRGVGLGRAQEYGPGFNKYFYESRERLILIAQIEHCDALQNLEEIFGSGLVDGYIVGPYDLSCSLGVPGDFEHPDMLAALTQIKESAKKYSVPGGLHVVEPDVQMMQRSIKSGHQIVIYSVDFRILEKSLSNAITQLRG
ncbi:HpcH/HpaI aldolase family protein [Arenicellales bacterium nBUS_48]